VTPPVKDKNKDNWQVEDKSRTLCVTGGNAVDPRAQGTWAAQQTDGISCNNMAVIDEAANVGCYHEHEFIAVGPEWCSW
jgi:hypothetical protein